MVGNYSDTFFSQTSLIWFPFCEANIQEDFFVLSPSSSFFLHETLELSLQVNYEMQRMDENRA